MRKGQSTIASLACRKALLEADADPTIRAQHGQDSEDVNPIIYAIDDNNDSSVRPEEVSPSYLYALLVLTTAVCSGAAATVRLRTHRPAEYVPRGRPHLALRVPFQKKINGPRSPAEMRL
jgi:hypothetical protein